MTDALQRTIEHLLEACEQRDWETIRRDIGFVYSLGFVDGLEKATELTP